MIIMIIRINYYRVTERYGGNSPTLIKCNYLAGYGVQPALTRCWGGLGLPCLR